MGCDHGTYVDSRVGVDSLSAVVSRRLCRCRLGHRGAAILGVGLRWATGVGCTLRFARTASPKSDSSASFIGSNDVGGGVLQTLLADARRFGGRLADSAISCRCRDQYGTGLFLRFR